MNIIKGTVTARTVKRVIGFRTLEAAQICLGRVNRSSPVRRPYAYLGSSEGGYVHEVIIIAFVEKAAIVDFERWTLRMSNVDTEQQGDDRTSVAYILPATFA